MEPLANQPTPIKMRFVTRLLQDKLQRRRRRDAKPYAEGINNCAPAAPIDGTGRSKSSIRPIMPATRLRSTTTEEL